MDGQPPGVLSAAEVALLLTEWGQRTALAGGNPYRARAYLRAAESLALIARPLEEIVAEGRLRQIPGVGSAIAGIIERLHRTGTHPALEEMRAAIPAGVLELLSLPGIRVERVMKMHRQLGINSIADLEHAARNDELAKAKGFGPAFQRKIIDALAARTEGRSALHLHRAERLLAAAEAQIREADDDAGRILPAGDYRRGNELVTDLVLVVERPGTGQSTRVSRGSLAIVPTGRAEFGAALLFATGNDRHVAELQSIAAGQGLSLSPTGLFEGDRFIAGKDEEEIYSRLGLQFVPPELREGRDELELAQRGALPSLVGMEDIRGILHAHTDQSDGVNTLQEMADAARTRGYSYFGVADHSQSAGYAGGLSVAEVKAQHEEIDRLNRGAHGFRIFKGIESDILADGSLDYPDTVLERFDFVVASIHGRFRLDRQTQTERIVKAVSNPHTTILGHMTGRQLLRRPGYDVDIERVLGACAEHGVAVEINANPWRLDLDWRWHQRGLSLGCTFSINPDAHSVDEIDMTTWGVLQARKGGIPADRVLNCLDLDAFDSFLRGRRR